MTEYVRIFGYGSLINVQSFKRTVFEVTDVVPAKLLGYKRFFGIPAGNRFTADGVPISVLNVIPDAEHTVNGIVASVPKSFFDNLQVREKEYSCVETEVIHYSNNTLEQAFIFVDSSGRYQDFLYDDPVQIGYLQECVVGARSTGKEFYKEFLMTTWIAENRLFSLPNLYQDSHM